MPFGPWPGDSGGGTLAKVYAAGLADPTIDNIFTMPTGVRRFQSTAPGTAFAFPNDAWFEDAATPADGRVGTTMTTRVQSAGKQVSTFESMQIYNAAFAADLVDGTYWVADLGLLTSDLTQTVQTGTEFWKHAYYGANFLNNFPLSNPYNGSNGKVVYQQESLYAHGNSTIGDRLARVTSGWGQEFVYPLPLQTGITPGFIAVWTDHDIPGADTIGTGTGIWFMYGDPAHQDTSKLRGAYEAAMLTTDPNGAWGLDLRAFDGAGNQPVVAHFDGTGGTVLSSQVLTSDVNGFSVYTLDIDMLSAVGTDLGTVIPARPGKFFQVHRVGMSVVSLTGAATNGPSVSIGTDSPTFVNITSSVSMTLGQINLGPREWNTANVAASTSPAVSNAAIHARMAVPVTGATALTIRLNLIGFWTAG